MPRVPSYDELPERDGVRCSWGVWGQHDVFGCLNRLTPERTATAGRLVERGAVFSLNWSMQLPRPAPVRPRTPAAEIRGSSRSRSQDDLLHDWNAQASRQWDGFRHVRREGHGHYGGVPDAEHGVHQLGPPGDRRPRRARRRLPLAGGGGPPAPPGFAGPGRARGRLETLAAQQTAVEPGDVLLLRTGWLPWYLTLDEQARAAISTAETLRTPGLRAVEQSARMLWDLQLAAVATDNPALEVWPIGALMDPEQVEAIRADPTREFEMLLHTRLLPMLGLPIGELWYLEALAEDCASDGRYACLLTSAPIDLPAGVASPPNALALK